MGFAKHIPIMIQMWKSATRTCDKNGLSLEGMGVL
jgi:hypothetical protein